VDVATCRHLLSVRAGAPLALALALQQKGHSAVASWLCSLGFGFGFCFCFCSCFGFGFGLVSARDSIRDSDSRFRFRCLAHSFSRKAKKQPASRERLFQNPEPSTQSPVSRKQNFRALKIGTSLRLAFGVRRLTFNETAKLKSNSPKTTQK
ncbi:hypothetical protein M5D96_004830, partial [Drosophila gunungcola]